MDGRIVVACDPCALSMDVPDNAFGRIMRDEFEKEHQSHRSKETS